MIWLANGASVLYQWERGVTVNCDKPCDVLSVWREDDKKAKRIVPAEVQGVYRIEIPRQLLQQSGYLRIEAIDAADDGERVIDTARIIIRPRKKPDDYPANGGEAEYWQSLNLRMNAIERKAREGDFDGEKGDDGITPHIGENGNWWLGEVDTGTPARGADGYTPQKGVDYFDGDDGITPHIGENGNWYIGDVDTGVLARGLLDLPSIGANGNWFIGGVDTGVAASGGESAPKNVWYGTCTSSSYMNTKYVVNTDTGDFALVKGNVLHVLFSYPSAANTTLNVDGTGEVPLKAYGTTNVVSGQWGSNEVASFVYDGEVFRLIDGYLANTTYYGMTKLSSSTSSTAENVAATPKAVKQAYDLATTAKTAAEGASQPGHTHSQSDITDFPSEMTPSAHNQAASTITAGTLAGKVQANASAAATVTTAQVRDIYAGTEDMTAGTTALASGTLYFVYE